MKRSLSSYLRKIKSRYFSLLIVALAFSLNTQAQISGLSGVCVSATITLSGTPAGGTWSSSSTTIATVGSSSGIVTGVAAGAATITYVSGVSTFTKPITVNALPTLCSVTGGGNYCAGGSGLHVGLACSSPGVSYQLLNGATPLGGALAGTGGPLDFGLQTAAGTYTVFATNTTTGCTRTMSGSAVITINPVPTAISGPTAYCSGGSGTLSSTPTGGIWSSGTTAVATIGSSSGIVSAATVGTTIITYTIPATSCATTTTVNVTNAPSPITVPSSVCTGSTITLTDATPGGVWSSSTTAIATIGSLSGILTGVTGGVATVAYSLGTLGCTVTATVSVTSGPASITGAASACVGSTISLSDATPGGTWSSANTTVATVSGAGVVTGLNPGTSTISYTVGSCAATLVVTVNYTPSTIGGPSKVCIGNTITLTDAVGGGVWSSVSSSVTVGSSSGSVTGVSAGAASINYSIGGCFITTIVTVTPVPTAIAGAGSVCVGQTTTLTDAIGGGTWASSNTGIATIGAGTGIVTGIASGSIIVSYTTGCTVIAPMVVNALSPVVGSPVVCVGTTTTLTDATPGGSWSSSAPSKATVSSLGVVTGVSAGTATISYSLTSGCVATVVVTINPLPLPIAGLSAVCVGATINMTDASPGGTWSSSNTALATVSPAGVVTGISSGIDTISYSFGSTTGCAAIKVITVNAAPAAIAGPGVVCLGTTMTLTDVGAGLWSSSNPAAATVGSASGIVSGITLGTTTIAFALSTGCVATKSVTVVNLPSAVAGPDSICIGSSSLFTDPSGAGTWTSSNVFVATVGSSTGLVTGMNAGIATITYASSPGCIASRVVTVNMLPTPIAGTLNICPLTSTTLTDAIGPGTWSSSNPAIATIGSTSGVVTAVTSGSTIIVYTLFTGCATSAFFTVSSGPVPITGYDHICIGSSAAFTDVTPGGGWVSSAPGIASVNSSGVVTGAAVGTALITYTTGTICPAVMPVTITPLPAAIAGASSICLGSSTTLTEAVPGGSWSSSNPLVATVGSSTGFVTGISASPVTISYTIGPACYAIKSMTVNTLPAPITGPNNVCQFQAITLSDATSGGAWSSSNPAIGSVDVLGDVTGITAGTITITYSNGFGCTTTYPVTVNTSPTAITGPGIVCLSNTVTLADAIPGGTWSSFNPAAATVGSASGIVTGISLGTAAIVYSMPGGCITSVIVTVDPLPTVYTVTGGGSHCATDTGVHIGLSGSDMGFIYLLYLGSTAVGSFPGTGTALDFGLLTVAGTYTVVSTNTITGCKVNMAGSAVVFILPSAITSVGINTTPGDTVCTGAAAHFTAVPVNGGTGPTYRWEVNSSPVGLGSSYVYIPADGDIVKVTMVSNAVCPLPDSVSDSVTMRVLPFENPLVSIHVTPDDTVCLGTHVTLIPVPTYGGPSPTYVWLRNGLTAGTGSTYVFVPVDGDVYNCVITSDYLCLLSGVDTSAPITMTVDTPVIPSLFIGAFPGTTVTQGSPDTLVAYVTNAILPTYQWYVNNTIVPGATTNMYINTYGAIVNDSITCVVSSNGPCHITTFQWVFVHVITGIGQLSMNSNISVLPNPNKGAFTVKGTLGTVTDEDVYLEMADMLGRVVYKNKILAKNGILNEQVEPGSSLANGMYILSVHTGAENKVFHIVIEQ